MFNWPWYSMGFPCFALKFQYSLCDVTVSKHSSVYSNRIFVYFLYEKSLFSPWGQILWFYTGSRHTINRWMFNWPWYSMGFPCFALKFQYSLCDVMVSKHSSVYRNRIFVYFLYEKSLGANSFKIYHNNPKYWYILAFANSVDSDQILYNVASDQDLHCLMYIQKYSVF